MLVKVADAYNVANFFYEFVYFLLTISSDSRPHEHCCNESGCKAESLLFKQKSNLYIGNFQTARVYTENRTDVITYHLKSVCYLRKNEHFFIAGANLISICENAREMLLILTAQLKIIYTTIAIQIARNNISEEFAYFKASFALREAVSQS